MDEEGTLETEEPAVELTLNTTAEHVLPPSHALLGIPLPVAKEGQPLNFLEANVGISEYIGRGDAKVEGIIKQRSLFLQSTNIILLMHSFAHRFTDFLVFEVDQDSKVIHLKFLGKPEVSKKEKAQEKAAVDTPTPVNAAETEKGSENPSSGIVQEDTAPTSTVEGSSVAAPALKISTKEEPWPEHFDATLTPFLDAEKVAQLKTIFLEGPEPPRISDSGWGSRVSSVIGENSVPAGVETAEVSDQKDSRSHSRGRGRKRGGRGGGREGGREDTRRVISAVRHCICD